MPGRFAMKTALPALVLGLPLALAFTPVFAQAMDDHKVVMPQEIPWTSAPAILPPGAQVALLYGDPSKEGIFVMRLRFPAGYKVAPHTHPAAEIVTVLSGALHLGTGETVDTSKVQVLPAGTFFAFKPGMAHFASTTEETVLQISTTGPWGVDYVNPKDDPRQKS